MRTIYLDPERTLRRVLGIRAILARLPGIASVTILIWLFFRDPLFPYHWMTSPLVHGFGLLMTNAAYRDVWMQDYLAITIVIVSVIIFFTYAMKVGLWDKAFKILKIRTREKDDIIETELGRAYWIEDYTSKKLRASLVGLLKGLHIVDIRIGSPPPAKVKYRRVSKRILTVAVPSSALKGAGLRMVEKMPPTPPETVKKPVASRTIFYLPYFRPINPVSPHRSMHRLVITVPDSGIEIHDGTIVLVEGVNLMRDLRQPYPTFILTPDTLDFVDMDIKQYRDDFNLMVQKACFTTTLASQMDTTLMKEQRKYQEVSVPVNPEMARLVMQKGEQP